MQLTSKLPWVWTCWSSFFSKRPMSKRNFLKMFNHFAIWVLFSSKGGTFNNAKNHLTGHASVAWFGVFRKIRYFNLPINLQLNLFYKIINPILLYSCVKCGVTKTLKFFENYFKYKIKYSKLYGVSRNWMVYIVTFC